MSILRVRRLCLAFLFVLLVSAVPAFASGAGLNLVQNGDFSAGTLGIQSDYVPVDPSITNVMWPAGVYTVADSALGRHDLWEFSGGHTTGTDPFMLVNGYADARHPNNLVWGQTVPVERNTTYTFEAFAKNLCCMNYVLPTADLSFYINGILVGIGGADGQPGLWSSITSDWFSGDAMSAVLSIRNGSNVYSGNDFGLDDIYFGTKDVTNNPAPEPASLVLMGSGLLAAARYARRRTSRSTSAESSVDSDRDATPPVI